MELILTIERPDGGQHDVRVEVDGETAGSELVGALGAAVDTSVPQRAWVRRTRNEILADRPVSEAGLLQGDAVFLAPSGETPEWANRDATVHQHRFELLVVGGARAGTRYPLLTGSYTLGRDPGCDIPIEDEQASRRHAHLGVGTDAVVATDLGSTNGTELDGQLLAEATPMRPGQVLTIGTTHMTIELVEPMRASRAAISQADGWLGFNRPPRVMRPEPSETVRLPVPPMKPHSRRLPMSAAVAPILMGGVLAFALHSPVMLLFMLMGPVMMGITIRDDRKSGRKDYAAAVKRFEQEVASLEERVAATHAELLEERRAAAPSPAHLVEQVQARSPELWQRRPTDKDALTFRIGMSDLPSRLRFDRAPEFEGADPGSGGGAKANADTEQAAELAHRLDVLEHRFQTDPDVPVDVDLTSVGVLGVAGESAARDALLRWLVLQATILDSPRDLAVVVLVPGSSSGQWDFTRWFPHTTTLVSGVPAGRTVATDADDVRALFQAVDDLITTRRLLEERQPGRSDAGWAPRVLLVIPGEIPVPRPALSRVLAGGPEFGVTAIVAASAVEHLPGECRAVVRVGAHEDDCSVTLTATGDTIPGIVVDGVPAALAEQTARRLAPLRDVTAAAAAGEVPSRVLLLDLLEMPEPSAEAIAQRWHSRRGSESLGAPIGVGSAGPISIDLRLDGPHGLTAGTTGSGKSEFLQSLVGSLAATYPADRLTFVLVDYKGGAAFKDCVELPHTVGFFTDLDAHLAQRALVSLNAELRRREHILRDNGAKDLIDLERRNPSAAPANLFIVFDEFAFLKKEVPEFVAGVIDIAQRGRSLGVHLMLATQRPSGVVDDNIRANTNLRIALRIADDADSNDVLDRPDAARIPKSLPGRAFIRTGHGDVQAVQTAYANARSSWGPQRQPTRVRPFTMSSGLLPAAAGSGGSSGGGADDDERPTDLQRLVAAIVAANAAEGIPAQPKPWLDPLAVHYDLGELLAEAPATSELSAVLGVVDRPDAQTQAPWELDLASAGHVLIYGTSGSGKTTVLRTLAASLARRLGPDDLALYGLDFASRGLAPLTALPQCGGIVAADEPERIDRLITMLERLVATRKDELAADGSSSLAEHRARGHRTPYVVLLVDGYAGFQASYLSVDHGDLIERFNRLVADGRSAGVHVAITADRRNAVPSTLSSLIAARIVLRMAEADEYASLGLPMSIAQTALAPGRGFVDGDTEVQIAVVGADASGAGQAAALSTWAADGGAGSVTSAAAARVEPLADVVPAESMPPVEPGRLLIPIGLSGITDGPSWVDLDDTGTFVVLGPDRSGRSSALAVLSEGVKAAHPGIEAYLIAPRRTPLTERDGWTEVAAGLDAADALCQRLADLVRTRAGTPGPPFMIVVDDGDELADTPGGNALVTVVRRGRDAGLIFLAAAQTHVVHRSFGGWLTDMRKAKHAAILSPDIDLDGELFGVRLPRKASRRFPLGRAYIVRRGDLDYVQLAQQSR